MSTLKQNSTAPMDVKTRKVKSLIILSKNPEDQQPVLNSSEIAAIILRFLQGLSENQWKEVNEGEYNESVKKKLNKAFTEVLKLSTNSIIKMFLQPTYIESIPSVCCCALRELAGDDIKNTFERVFRRALQEIGGVDIHIKISQKLCYDMEICVIHKVCSALLLRTQASSDQAVIVDADTYMVKDYKMSKKTWAGAISTMRSFLTGQVDTIRRNIWKKEKAENKKARKAKKKMSLWKRCVLKMHERKVRSILSSGSIGYDDLDYYEPSSTTQTGEQQHPSHLLTHPTHDSHGCSLRAAADPENEVYTSEPAGNSSGALEESGSALKDTIIQVLPFEDPEEKERAEILRQPVFGIRQKKEALTEQPQISNGQSSDSDLEEEIATSFNYAKRRIVRAWSPLPTDLDPFDTLARGDTSTTQTGELQHLSHLLTHPTHHFHGRSLRAAADPKKEVYTSEPAGSSSGALEESGSALKDTIIQVLPFEDPEEKERAEILRQPVFGITLKKEAPTEQPQISNRQSSDSDLEEETATSINYPKRRVERAWSLLPTDLDPFDTLARDDLSTTQTGEQQHPSHSLTHPTHDSHGCSLRAAADPKKEVYTSEPAGSSSGALEESGSALKDTIIQVLPFEDPEEKERAEILRQPVFGIRQKKEAPTEQPQISNGQSSDLEEETVTSINYSPKKIPFWERFRLPLRSNRVHPVFTAGLNSFDTLARDDLSTTQTVEQQAASCSLTGSIPNTSNAHSRSNLQITTPTVQSFTAPKEDNMSTSLVLEHLVEDDTNQDKSDDDLRFTIVEPILIDQQIFEATEDSQEKMKTFPDRQSDNETSASENTDTTETQAKEKKGFFSSLRRFFKKDKKENESLEKKERKLCNWKMLFLCCPAQPESL